LKQAPFLEKKEKVAKQKELSLVEMDIRPGIPPGGAAADRFDPAGRHNF